MSIKIMTWVFDESPTEGAERLVLLALADNANDEGYCWPSLATIARKSGIDRRSTIRLIKKLEAKQLLQVERRWNPDRLINDTNRYRILWKVVRGGDYRSLGSDSRSPGSDTESLGVVTESHPNLNLNHHLNHQVNHQLTTTTTTHGDTTMPGDGGPPLVVVVWQQAEKQLLEMGIFEKLVPDYITLAQTLGWQEGQLIGLARSLLLEYEQGRACRLLKRRIEKTNPNSISGYAQSNSGICEVCHAMPCTCSAKDKGWLCLDWDQLEYFGNMGLSTDQLEQLDDLNSVQLWTDEDLRRIAEECSSPEIFLSHLQSNPRGK